MSCRRHAKAHGTENLFQDVPVHRITRLRRPYFRVLSVAFDYENEWPLRIGNLIPDVDEWYTTHPSLLEFSGG